jgi:molybdopterin-guanine dinucleotide biosynthesis protein A
MGDAIAMEESVVSERRFLQSTLTELKILEDAARAHYHGILAGMLTAARREAEMLLREDMQAQAWPRSGEDRQVGHH